MKIRTLELKAKARIKGLPQSIDEQMQDQHD